MLFLGTHCGRASRRKSLVHRWDFQLMIARLPGSARLSSVVFLLQLYLSTKRGARSIDAQYRGSALLITEEDLGQA